MNALTDWLAERGGEPGPLFSPVNKGGRLIRFKDLSDQSIYDVVAKRVKEAGLSRTCTPHDLRRAFVTTLLDRGNDVAVVSRLAGHASVATTVIYDWRSVDEERKAQESMHLPYTGPIPQPVTQRSRWIRSNRMTTREIENDTLCTKRSPTPILTQMLV